jgi:hypothetical protein
MIAKGRPPMLDTTQAAITGKAASNPQAVGFVAPSRQEAQTSEIPGFGLDRRARWSVPRKSARPINLERRARFARFDVA